MPKTASILAFLGCSFVVLGGFLLISGLWPIPDFSTAMDAPASEGIAISLQLRPFELEFGGAFLLLGIALLCWRLVRRGPAV